MSTIKSLFAYSPLSLAMVSVLAQASSAVGTDNQLGNELNPSGLPVLCTPDPEGLQLFNNSSRTPTGFRYQQPCLKPEMDDTGEGWIVFGSVEGGVVGSGGDDHNAYFVEYADRSDTPTITQISLKAEDRDSARYAQVNAGNLGRDDQHLEAQLGKAGSYQARFVYNNIPHVYATNAKTPYQGVGSGNLTLPAEIPPNSVSSRFAGSVEALNDYIAAQDDLTLRVDRERLGLSADYEFSDGLKGYFDLKHEERDGLKAYGGGFNFDFLDASFGIGAINEIIQPIDYSSDDLTVGLNYQGRGYNLNASYTGSFFRNAIDSLTYENPWDTTGGFGGSYSPVTGQTDLAPDNDFNQFRVEGNVELPWWQGLATLTLSRGKMEQDDQLLPYTSNTGNLFGVDLSDWNTTAALPRQSANARIDTGLEQLKLSFKPADQLGLKLGYRHYQEDNKTPPFETCNALTGQCAFMFLDGGLQSSFGAFGANWFILYDPDNGTFGNFHYKSVPWDYDKENYSAGLSYQLSPKTKLGFDYQRENIERSYREVDETDEDKYRLNLVHRNGDWGTVRVEAGYAQRDFDGQYNANPYEPFWTEHLMEALVADPDTDPTIAAAAQAYLDNSIEPHTLEELRKYDLSQRDQYTLAVKFNLAVGAQSDLMLTADYKDNDYDAAFGLEGDETSNLGAEYSHALGAASNWYLSYHYQKISSSMRSVDSTDIGSHDGSFGGDYYPANHAWGSDEDEDSHFVSAGFETQLSPRYRLGASYSYGLTKTKVSYAAVSNLALNSSMTASGDINGSFDDIRYQQQIVQANLRGQINPQFSWRLFAVYEFGEVDDFHYDGMQYADSGKMLLGTTVDDWDAYTLGLLAQYQF